MSHDCSEPAAADFQSAVEADFLELQRRVLARHKQSLEELDRSWQSAGSAGQDNRRRLPLVQKSQPGSRKSLPCSGQDVQLGACPSTLLGDVALHIEGSATRGLSSQSMPPSTSERLPIPVMQGLQLIVNQCNQQSHALEVLSDKIDRATVRMGLQTLRLREHRDFGGINGVDTWNTETAATSRVTNTSFATNSNATLPGIGQEDYRPHPAWRRRSRLKTPRSVMKHRSYAWYHQRVLSTMDLDDTDSNAASKRHVVVPNSKYRLAWEIIAMMFLTYDLVVVPLLVFQPQSSIPFRIADWMLLIFWTFDIFMSFRLAYFNKQGQLQTDLRAIAIHYCKRWFLFDFCIATIDWIVLVALRGKSVLKSAKVMRGLRFLRIFRLLRIVKITHFVNSMRLRISSQYAYVVTGIIEYLVMLILINHLIACSWFWIGNSGASPNWVEHYGLTKANLGHKYIVSLHWSLTQFTPASMQVQPQNATEQIFAVCVLMLALVVFGSLISSITVAMTALRSVNFMKADQFWLLRKYLRQHCISEDLTMHVTRYLTIAVSRQRARIQEDQVQILALLSAPLRVRLKNELFSKLLVVHPLFERMYQRCMNVINMLCCTAIQEDRLSREDQLFHCGEAAKKMYFVEEGKLAYLREKHKMQFLGQHEFCCEVILWCPWVHRGDMHARTDCTVLALDSEQFREVVLSFPADAELPRRYGKVFCKSIQEQFISSRSVTDSLGLDDIQAGKLDLKKILASIIVKGDFDGAPVDPQEDEDDEEGDTPQKERCNLQDGKTITLHDLDHAESGLQQSDYAAPSGTASTARAVQSGKSDFHARTACSSGSRSTLVSFKSYEDTTTGI